MAQDWFDQNAPKTPSTGGGDWFAQNHPASQAPTAPPTATPPTQAAQAQEPSLFRKLLGGGTRVGSAILSSEGGFPGAAISGAGEALAQALEGSKPDLTSIGTEAAFGAVPFGKVVKEGKTAADIGMSALRSGGLGAAHTAVSDLAHGHLPHLGDLATSFGLGGLMGAGGSAWAGRAKPTSYDVVPTAQTGEGTSTTTFKNNGKVDERGISKAPEPIVGGSSPIGMQGPIPSNERTTINHGEVPPAPTPQPLADNQLAPKDQVRQVQRDDKNLRDVQNWLAGKRKVATAQQEALAAGGERTTPTYTESASTPIPGGRATTSSRIVPPPPTPNTPPLGAAPTPPTLPNITPSAVVNDSGKASSLESLLGGKKSTAPVSTAPVVAPGEPASSPQISDLTRQTLKNLGYSDDTISKLTPDQAAYEMQSEMAVNDELASGHDSSPRLQELRRQYNIPEPNQTPVQPVATSPAHQYALDHYPDEVNAELDKLGEAYRAGDKSAGKSMAELRDFMNPKAKMRESWKGAPPVAGTSSAFAPAEGGSSGPSIRSEKGIDGRNRVWVNGQEQGLHFNGGPTDTEVNELYNQVKDPKSYARLNELKKQQFTGLAKPSLEPTAIPPTEGSIGEQVAARQVEGPVSAPPSTPPSAPPLGPPPPNTGEDKILPAPQREMSPEEIQGENDWIDRLKGEQGQINPKLLRLGSSLTGAAIGAPIGSKLDQDNPGEGALKGALAGGALGYGAAAGGEGLKNLTNFRNAELLTGPAQAKKPLSDLGAYIGLMGEKAAGGDTGTASNLLKEMLRVPTNARNYLAGLKDPKAAAQAIGINPDEFNSTGLMNYVARPFSAAQNATQGAMERAGVPRDEAVRTLMVGEPRMPFFKNLLKLQNTEGIGGQLYRFAHPFARIGTNIAERGIERLPGVSYFNGDPNTRTARSIIGSLAVGGGALTGMHDAQNADQGEPTSPVVKGLRRAAMASYGLPFAAGEAMTAPGGPKEVYDLIPGISEVVPSPGPKETWSDVLPKFLKKNVFDRMLPSFMNPDTGAAR